MTKIKPIQKFNNSRGATLCHSCSVIISEGLTKELYCEKCKPKQETLEEAAWRVFGKDEDNFYDGAKWQQERSYSEKEVKDIVDETIEKFYKHFYTLTKAEMKEQWFEQFKKK